MSVRNIYIMVVTALAMLTACSAGDESVGLGDGRGELLTLSIRNVTVDVSVTRAGDAVLSCGTAFADDDVVGVYVVDEAQDEALRAGLPLTSAVTDYHPYINIPCRVTGNGSLVPLDGYGGLRFPLDKNDGIRVYAYYPWDAGNDVNQLERGLSVSVAANQTDTSSCLHSDFLSGVTDSICHKVIGIPVWVTMHHRMSCLKVRIKMLPTNVTRCDKASLTLDHVATSGTYNLVTGQWTDKHDGSVYSETEGVDEADVAAGDSVARTFVMLVLPEAGAGAANPERIENKTTFTLSLDDSKTLMRTDRYAYSHNEGYIRRYLLNVDESQLEFNGEPEESDEDWVVNPYDYRYDMTAYVALAVNGALVDDLSRYSIAAFCDDECRGRMLVRVAYGAQYGYLRIRSNVATGETMTIKVYDRQEKVMIPCTDVIEFASNSLVGTPSNPMILGR